MDASDIMVCIEMLTDMLPKLRDCLGITQRELAGVIGISRQSVIDLEHKKPQNYPVNIDCNDYFFLSPLRNCLAFVQKGFLFYELRDITWLY